MLPPCGVHRSCNSISPVGVEEDVDERGGDGWQRGWVQRHDAELVLRDEHWVDCRLDGCKRHDCVLPVMIIVNSKTCKSQTLTLR